MSAVDRIKARQMGVDYDPEVWAAYRKAQAQVARERAADARRLEKAQQDHLNGTLMRASMGLNERADRARRRAIVRATARVDAALHALRAAVEV